jgi:hypothetical protein
MHLILLCGEINHGGPRCGFLILLTLRANHEEDNFPGPRDDLPAFLDIDQGNNTRWDYLGYPVQFSVQINNNITRPRLIYNMTFL